MKRLILLFVFLLLISPAAWAEGGNLSLNEPWPCLYLFKNLEYVDPCIFGTGYFTFYCCALPGYRAIGCFSFSISLSSDNLTLSNVVYPTEVTVTEGGDLPGDVTACLGCYIDDWHVLFSATVFVGADSEEAVMIGPFTGESAPIEISCDGVEEYVSCRNLLINDETCWVVAVYESSWGAIKSLYR